MAPHVDPRFWSFEGTASSLLISWSRFACQTSESLRFVRVGGASSSAVVIGALAMGGMGDSFATGGTGEGFVGAATGVAFGGEGEGFDAVGTAFDEAGETGGTSDFGGSGGAAAAPRSAAFFFARSAAASRSSSSLARLSLALIRLSAISFFCNAIKSTGGISGVV
jgi:hypothetical protein